MNGTEFTVSVSRAIYDALAPIPPDRVAQRAARGVAAALILHLRKKNASTTRKPGWPKTDFYGTAARRVRAWPAGNPGLNGADSKAQVVINHTGLRLRLRGGIVRPTGGRKYLAIPARPEVAGKNPREFSGSDVFFVARRALGKAWLARREPSGHLRILWFLTRQTVHKADPSVLPSDEELRRAAAEAALLFFTSLPKR